MMVKNDIWAQKNEELLTMIVPRAALTAVLSCPTGQLSSVQRELGLIVATQIGGDLFGDLHFQVLNEVVDKTIETHAAKLVAVEELNHAKFDEVVEECEAAVLAIPRIERLQDRRQVPEEATPLPN